MSTYTYREQAMLNSSEAHNIYLKKWLLFYVYLLHRKLLLYTVQSHAISHSSSTILENKQWILLFTSNIHFRESYQKPLSLIKSFKSVIVSPFCRASRLRAGNQQQCCSIGETPDNNTAAETVNKLFFREISLCKLNPQYSQELI